MRSSRQFFFFFFFTKRFYKQKKHKTHISEQKKKKVALFIFYEKILQTPKVQNAYKGTTKQTKKDSDFMRLKISKAKKVDYSSICVLCFLCFLCFLCVQNLFAKK